MLLSLLPAFCQRWLVGWSYYLPFLPRIVFLFLASNIMNPPPITRVEPCQGVCAISRLVVAWPARFR